MKTAKLPRIRPRSTRDRPTRSGNVLRVAGELFLSKGYAGVSIQMIVARTGGSYRDLYVEFGGKEALFLRVMIDVCSDVLAPLRANAEAGEKRHQPLDEALFLIARSVLQAILSPRVLRLHRLIVSEAPRFPDLATKFVEAGPGSATTALASFLQSRVLSDKLLINDSKVAAAIFLDSLISNLQLRALMGSTITRSDMDERAREATRIFLNGISSGSRK